MKFYINGKETDVSLENEKNVGEVLSSFQQMCDENNAVITYINIDGTTCTEDNFDELTAKDLSADTVISVSVYTADDVKYLLTASGKKFASLTPEIENIPAKLQTGKDAEAHTVIAALANTTSEFCNTVSLASLFPTVISSIKIDGKNVNDFFAEFQNIFCELEEALSSGDTVLIGDLAEYEICPRLNLLSAALGGNA